LRRAVNKIEVRIENSHFSFIFLEEFVAELRIVIMQGPATNTNLEYAEYINSLNQPGASSVKAIIYDGQGEPVS
jgi:hypothetical protein